MFYLPGTRPFILTPGFLISLSSLAQLQGRMSEEVLDYSAMLGLAFKPEEIEALRRCPMFVAALERVTSRREFKALCAMGGSLLTAETHPRPNTG